MCRRASWPTGITHESQDHETSRSNVKQLVLISLVAKVDQGLWTFAGVGAPVYAACPPFYVYVVHVALWTARKVARGQASEVPRDIGDR